MNHAHPQLHATSAGATHRGKVRKVNEDAYLDRPDIGLWAVADGMGGHTAGDLASRAIVQALDQAPQSRLLGQAVADLSERLGDVNRQLCAEARHRGVPIIGSTVAALVAVGGRCVSLWVGDSRIYRLRNGTLHRLSHDHSQVQLLVDQGLLSPDAAEDHPAANIVTRAMGTTQMPEIDTRIHEIMPGDRLLLCTDGLTKEVPEDTIAEQATRLAVDTLPQALIDEACNRGGRDNITVVVVDFSDE